MADQVLSQDAPAVGVFQGNAALSASTDDTIIAANPERARVIISVPTGDTVWLGYGEPAVVGSGHCVNGGGLPFEETVFKGAIHALSASAISVAFTELSYNLGDSTMGNEQPAGASTFVPSGPSDGHPSTDVPEFWQQGEYEPTSI